MADGNTPYSDEELKKKLKETQEAINELLDFDTIFQGIDDPFIPEIDENTPSAGTSQELILPPDTSFREPDRLQQQLREIQGSNRRFSTDFREELKNARNIEISKSKGKGKGKGKGKSKGKGKGRSKGKGKGKGRTLPQDPPLSIGRRLRGKGNNRRKKGGYKSKKKKKKKNTRKKK